MQTPPLVAMKWRASSYLASYGQSANPAPIMSGEDSCEGLSCLMTPEAISKTVLKQGSIPDGICCQDRCCVKWRRGTRSEHNLEFKNAKKTRGGIFTLNDFYDENPPVNLFADLQGPIYARGLPGSREIRWRAFSMDGSTRRVIQRKRRKHDRPMPPW